jgi:hypothetical protein
MPLKFIQRSRGVSRLSGYRGAEEEALKEYRGGR